MSESRTDLVPLHKGKGYPQDCGKNRTISLLSEMDENWTKFMIDRVVKSTDK